MSKVLYFLACIAVFSAGAYVWKIKYAGLTQVIAAEPEAKPAATPAPQDFQPQGVVVEVGGEKVTQEDVDWEYDLLTADVANKEELTPIPDLGSRYAEELAPLKKTLVANLIERKLLYTYVQRDRDFAYDDPKRYTECLTEWQDSVRAQARAVQGKGGKERLKARLCERAILDQYMRERLFAAVSVADAEVVEYYKNHRTDFREPETVTIRHMLLTDEAEAKTRRAQVNAHNFADMAKEHSIAPEAAKGGKLGPYAHGALPAVFDFALHMKKGEISEVLKSNYGYHLIMLLDHKGKTELGLEQARPKIVKILRKKKEDEAYKEWVNKALATVTVSTPKPLW